MHRVAEIANFLILVVGFAVSGIVVRRYPLLSIVCFTIAGANIVTHGLTELRYIWDQVSVNKFPCIYWSAWLLVSLPTIFHISAELKNLKTKVSVRKLFHVLIVVMFGPFLVRRTRSEFMAVSGMLVIASLIVIEAVRVSTVSPKLSHFLTSLIRPLLDKKDSSAKIVTSHAELLLAAVGPTILSEIFHVSFSTETLVSGILTVGIGDSFAAIVGTSCMQPRTLPWSNKSLQGASAFVISVTACLALTQLLTPSTLGATIVAAAVEAWIPNFDNVTLPIVFSLVHAFLR